MTIKKDLFTLNKMKIKELKNGLLKLNEAQLNELTKGLLNPRKNDLYNFI